MGTIVLFPRKLHGRASAEAFGRTSRGAAKKAKSSAVRQARWAVPVLSTLSHQSAGIESRSHHLRTASGFALMSEAISNRDDHSSMTSRKDVGVLIMPPDIVHSVLPRKYEMSCDREGRFVDNQSMTRMTETEEKAAFISRTRQAREAKFQTQKPVYEFLQVPQSHYKFWETTREMPRRFIPKFCTICEVSMEWLLTGEGKGPASIDYPREVTKRQPHNRNKRQRAA